MSDVVPAGTDERFGCTREVDTKLRVLNTITILMAGTTPPVQTHLAFVLAISLHICYEMSSTNGACAITRHGGENTACSAGLPRYMPTYALRDVRY